MNYRYLLFLFIMYCTLESHNFTTRVFTTFGKASVIIAKRDFHSRSFTHNPAIKQATSKCVHQEFTRIEEMVSASTETLRENIALTQEEILTKLRTDHPKFVAMVLSLIEKTPETVEGIVKWTPFLQSKMAGWLAQLDEEQARLFCKIRNSKDETFETFLNKTTTLKKLFEDATKKFSK